MLGPRIIHESTWTYPEEMKLSNGSERGCAGGLVRSYARDRKDS